MHIKWIRFVVNGRGPGSEEDLDDGCRSNSISSCSTPYSREVEIIVPRFTRGRERNRYWGQHSGIQLISTHGRAHIPMLMLHNLVKKVRVAFTRKSTKRRESNLFGLGK